MKQLAALLCALMLILSVPVAAHAADDVYTEGTLYYTIGDETVTIVGCFGRKDEVTVPASIAGYPVNTIGSGAFMTNRYLKKLNLPDTITVIEDGAIAEGIRVIYNANTDHPQGEPTDIITGREPIRTPSKSDATQPTKSADKQPTTSAAKGADATKAAPAPTNAGGDKVRGIGSSRVSSRSGFRRKRRSSCDGCKRFRYSRRVDFRAASCCRCLCNDG